MKTSVLQDEEIQGPLCPNCGKEMKLIESEDEVRDWEGNTDGYTWKRDWFCENEQDYYPFEFEKEESLVTFM